jgi:AcrR family transcriptional regulator
MNQNATRTRLLRSARKLFGNKGFRGASVREITTSAGANLGAVTYHFGSKADLYAEVLDGLFDQIATRIEQACIAGATPTEGMRAIVAAVFGYFVEAPDVPRLMVHQLSLGTAPPEVIRRHLRRILAAVDRVVEAGRSCGDFRPVDPVLIAFSLMSQSVWFALAGRTIGPVLFPGVDRDALARTIEGHIADVVARALNAGSVAP